MGYDQDKLFQIQIEINEKSGKIGLLGDTHWKFLFSFSEMGELADLVNKIPDNIKFIVVSSYQSRFIKKFKGVTLVNIKAFNKKNNNYQKAINIG